jgi:acetyl-CoA carboxylase, biotin carboxylase subunit
MFKRVLIANRGEIANRIISTCLDLGIETVAIYSDDDRSLHYLNRADYAYRVGEGDASSSYKNREAVLAIAKIAEVDCIHAGYGFLAEDKEFARLCKEQKIEFIGSNYELLVRSENKIKLRELAEKLGVKTVPHCTKPLLNISEAKQEAKKIGYPVMIKPVCGLHGRGLRRVEDAEAFEQAFSATKLEASIVLDDDSVLIEQALDGAKHIEVPVLRDKKGHVLALPELDCSVQRLYTKIVAETPSSSISEKTRTCLRESASKIAKGIELVGLATFEFLVKGEDVYFLEITPRLTVEHSITEMVTGFDLVKYQFLISSDDELDVYEKDLKCRGTAMQCRIYAEDPQSFEPYSGVVDDMFVPMGPHVRHEIVAHSNWFVPIHYDHMLAKMSVWGRDRAIVIRKMTHLLRDYFYSGIITNIPLQRQIFSHKSMINGTYDVDFMRKDFVFNREELPQNYDTAMTIATAIRVFKKEEKIRGSKEFVSEPISTWQKELGTGRL